jgi:hypothetical protein
VAFGARDTPVADAVILDPMVDRAPGSEPAPLQRGAGVGRYTILSLLGRDGVGEVWAAYDPGLDRKVALKVLQAQDAAAQAGLVREAKAMARLSHPNVVAVHDVGTFGARVFVAMELVDGVTLREWLAERPRARPEILAIFLEAARGLAAAHAAGLVHGGFEPDNVMLARDGSVRVMDFAASQAADARADQLAFCAALREALPAGTVPVWLERVLLRGLAAAPDARWASMDELVLALGRDPARARRRWALAAGAALLIGLAAVTVTRDRQRPTSICQGGPARLADVWEPATPPHPRRDAVEKAFLASSAPAAQEVWQRVSSLLDRFAAAWLGMYRDACEATHVRKQQSAASLDLRMACLDERRTALLALLDVLAKADRDVVTSATDAVNALPPLERCADLEQLHRSFEPPRNEAARVRVDDLRKRLATTKALNDAGKHAEAHRLGTIQVAEARTLGYTPLLAEALVTLGNTSLGGNYGPDAIPIDEEAVWTALATSRDDLAAEAAVLTANVLSAYEGRPVDGAYWAALAESLLDRAGEGQGRIRSWLLHGQAVRSLMEKKPQRALELVQKALALKEKLLPPDHPDIAASLNTEAEALVALDRKPEALVVNERACDLIAKAYGASSTDLAMVLSNRGEYLVDLGRPAEALVPLRRALAIWKVQLSVDHQFLGYTLTALGRAYAALGRSSDAVTTLERALSIREAREPDAGLVAETRFALAQARAGAPTGRHTRTETAPSPSRYSEPNGR